MRLKKVYILEGIAVLAALTALCWFSIPRFLAAQNLNTPENFPDPVFRRAVEQLMKVEPGGKFFRHEAEAQEGYLNLTDAIARNRKAKNLKGIEFFPNIRYLNCRQNDLTELDISKLTKLVSLDCCENRLATLDLSNQPLLNTLKCSGNLLEELDVSHNGNLIYLSCVHNHLKRLSLVHNPNLKILFCSDNQLQDIDLSQNPRIRSLMLHNNRLKTIDVSSIVQLESFSCGLNELRMLDVSRNAVLGSLSCLANHLAELDVSFNPQLKSLNCSANPISLIRLHPQASYGSIDCSVDNIESLDMFLPFVNNLKTARIDLRHNLLSDDDYDDLKQLLTSLGYWNRYLNLEGDSKPQIPIQVYPQKGTHKRLKPLSKEDGNEN